jgi:hypothetical protein
MDESAFLNVPVGRFQVAFANALAISRGCDTYDGALEEFKRRMGAEKSSSFGSSTHDAWCDEPKCLGPCNCNLPKRSM